MHICPAEQTIPQPPQLARSMFGLTQAPAQRIALDAHCGRQVDAQVGQVRAQNSPAAHCLPQAPQCSAAVGP